MEIKKSTIVALLPVIELLLCLNLFVMKYEINTAHAGGGAGNDAYLMVSGLVDSNNDYIYILNVATKRLGVYKATGQGQLGLHSVRYIDEDLKEIWSWKNTDASPSVSEMKVINDKARAARGQNTPAEGEHSSDDPKDAPKDAPKK